MWFISGFIGLFLGRFLIGGLLNFFLKSEERDDPDPENALGWVGAIIGAGIAMALFH